MGSLTDYFERKVLNAFCGNDAAMASTSMWVAMYTATPSDASGGTEVTGGNYARKSSGAWSTATGASGWVANTATITYATATLSWGNVSHFALLDDSSTGNMVAWATLTATRDIGTNDVAAFAIGSLTIALD